ncbi:MAG: hypothetical protein FWB75_08310, partial [Oscillospiraceae bacterium]|nr:hypothetical protein [Oscillospiraceae bacterium]
PHGELQRGNLEALMAELCPKEDKSFFLMSYLTCKELYERYLGSLGTKEEAVDYLLNKEKKYRNLVKKKDMPCCIALVLADTEVDESCTYPTADELRESIAEIEALRIKK